jgi:hypothetical protein
MAFNDDPKVDQFYKNSEESVLAVRSFFLCKNGFICRSETPDFGVDEDVELIIDDQASGKKFAIQIKSVESAMIIRNNQFVSLQFYTSRLGYLCRRPPAYGIIIIYDDTTKACYYEFTEVLINRLSDHHNSEDWKLQEKININIPTSQKLNQEAVETIYKLMVERHRNNQFMLSSYGKDYNIPVFEDSITKNQNDHRSPEETIHFLKKNWLILLDTNEIDYLRYLINKLTVAEITRSKELTLLAAIVHCETGNFIDADFYLNKGAFITDYTEFEKNSFLFIRYKVDFAFGRFNNNTYLTNLENQLKSITGNYNTILIKINIIYIKLLVSLNERKNNNSLLSEINDLFDTIHKTDINETRKFYLQNYHAFNLHVFAINLIIHKITNDKIKESLNMTVSIQDKLSEINEIIEVLDLPKKYTLEALKYAEDRNNLHLKSISLFQLGHYFFAFQVNMMMLDVNTSYLHEETKTEFEQKINCSLNAYMGFMELSRYGNAYNALTLSYELTCLFEMLYNKQISTNKLEDIETGIRDIEKQINIKPFNSIVKRAFNQKEVLRKQSFKDFINVPTVELEFYAQIMLEGMNLPTERKIYLINDMENHKTFYNKRKSESLELLQDLTHTQNRETHYATNPTYIIQCKKCGFRTPFNIDINNLLLISESHICNAIKT